MNRVTIHCRDKYESQKLASLIFVNETKETYIAEILNVVENEIVLSIKDKSAHSVILKDNDQTLLFTDFIQSVIEKINEFLAVHQQKREMARNQLDKFLLKD